MGCDVDSLSCAGCASRVPVGRCLARSRLALGRFCLDHGQEGQNRPGKGAIAWIFFCAMRDLAPCGAFLYSSLFFAV